MTDTGRRALVAAAVSLAGALIGVAGAGHAYLREWGRAFAWFSFVLGVGLVLIAAFADPATATLATLPLRVTAPLALLFGLNTLDAYRVAHRSTADETTGDTSPTCPSCGRELDPDLSFCPWCAGSRGEED
ncbi:MAG: zinc ribbon domain-containing protein [Haloplanus sp.]